MAKLTDTQVIYRIVTGSGMILRGTEDLGEGKVRVRVGHPLRVPAGARTPERALEVLKAQAYVAWTEILAEERQPNEIDTGRRMAIWTLDLLLPKEKDRPDVTRSFRKRPPQT